MEKKLNNHSNHTLEGLSGSLALAVAREGKAEMAAELERLTDLELWAVAASIGIIFSSETKEKIIEAIQVRTIVPSIKTPTEI